MRQVDAAVLEDVGIADPSLLLSLGDSVCVKAGTPDPDFPDRQLDGWTGVIVELDETVIPAQYLVQWDQATISGMPPEDRKRCEIEDFALDRMWLLEEDFEVPLP
jgi:hypothetical protein